MTLLEEIIKSYRLSTKLTNARERVISDLKEEGRAFTLSSEIAQEMEKEGFKVKWLEGGLLGGVNSWSISIPEEKF